MGNRVDPPLTDLVPGDRSGGLLRALVSGDRGSLSEEVRQTFVRSGTAHLLAISGLHVGWIFALTQICVHLALRSVPSLGILRRARSWSLTCGVLAASAYAALSGFGVPALRAAAMAFAGTLAVLGGRPGATWNVLALAALVVLAWSPASLFEPAFALSFVAVMGILIWRPSGGRIRRLAHSTLGAGLATAPLVAAIGAPLPPASLLANMVAIPFFGAVVLPLALCASVLEALGPVAHAAAELGIRLLEVFAGGDLLEGSTQPVPRALSIAGLSFLVRLLWLRRGIGALAAGAITALGVFASDPPAPGQSLLFLDVGHGDATVLRSADRAWLIDAGPQYGRFDAGRYVVRPALRAVSLGRLEVLVLTHADRDHIGGARTILATMPVGELWMSRASYEADALEPVRRVAAQRGVPIRLAAAGDRARLPPLEVSVLWPPAGLRTSASNDTSLVLRIDGPHGCAMLPGDAPTDVERRLTRGQQRCEVLKLAHHGSRTSTGRAWLERLQPWLAVASAGGRPASPLPHADVARRLRIESVTLYRTHALGAIRVRFTPEGIVADPYLTRPWLETDP
jgi:competence protein ComEC